MYAKSLENFKTLDTDAELGILDSKVSDCIYKTKGGCGAVALHPFWRGMDLTAEQLKGYTIRAWMSGHLYPEKPTGGRLDFAQLEAQARILIIIGLTARSISPSLLCHLKRIAHRSLQVRTKKILPNRSKIAREVLTLRNIIIDS